MADTQTDSVVLKQDDARSETRASSSRSRRKGRRRGSGPSLGLIVGILGGLAVVVAAGVFFFSDKKQAGFDGVPVLKPEEFLNNAQSLRGNVFSLNATVDEQLKLTEKGRLFSMLAKRTDGGEAELLPVFFPDDFRSANLLKGQEFTLKVEIDRNGVLRVQQIQKR